MCLIVVPLLVANTQIVEVEGFGMSHFGANLAPLGVDITIGELYKVESILDVRLQVLEGNVYLGFVLDLILELASQTAADDRKRLATEVLAKLEELEEAKAIALVIIGIKAMGEGVLPTVLVDGAIFNGTYRVLPLVALLKVGALDDAAAGETEYAGLQVAKCLSKILTHTILAALPGILGEHRDVLEVGSHDWFLLVKATKEDTEGKIIGSYFCGNLCGVLLPFFSLYVNATGCRFLGLTHRVVIGEPEEQGALAAIWATSPKAYTIDFIGLGGDTEEALVLNTGALVYVTRIGKTYIMRITLEWTIVTNFNLAEGLPAHQGLGKFERTVLDHFGIEAAVGSIVDVFEEDAVHGVLDFGTRLCGLDEQFAGGDSRLIVTRSECYGTKGQEGKRSKISFHCAFLEFNVRYIIELMIVDRSCFNRCKDSAFFWKFYIYSLRK